MKQVYRQLSKYRGQGKTIWWNQLTAILTKLIENATFLFRISGALSTAPRGGLISSYIHSGNKDYPQSAAFDSQKKGHEEKQEQTKNKENEIVVNGFQTGEFYNYGFCQKNRTAKEDAENQFDKYRETCYRTSDSLSRR